MKTSFWKTVPHNSNSQEEAAQMELNTKGMLKKLGNDIGSYEDLVSEE